MTEGFARRGWLVAHLCRVLRFFADKIDEVAESFRVIECSAMNNSWSAQGMSVSKSSRCCPFQTRNLRAAKASF
jgi:hypothetical protein